MYAYPVHSSVPAPAPQPEPVGNRPSAGRLAWGLKTHPIVTGTAVLALSGRCSRGRRNSGGPRRQSAALSGRPPAVRLTAIKKGAITGVMAPLGFHVCVYTAVGAPAGFPCPTLPQACPSVCLHTKFGSGPCLGAAPGGEPYPYIKSERLFPLHSICMEKSAYHSACRCGMGCAGRHSPCLPNRKERWSLDPQNKKLYLLGYSKQTLYDTCLDHKPLHPPWTGEASCASYTGRYSDSGIQRSSRLPRA